MHEYARRELLELLVRSFSVPELRILLGDLDPGLDSDLPTDTTPRQFAAAVLTCLEQRNRLDEEFFALIEKERPRLREELDAIRERLNGVKRLNLPRTSGERAAVFEGPRGTRIMALRDFTGRLEPLAELEHLLSAHTTVCVVANGIGGVGKTTFVQEFVARRGAACFPDGSAWLDGQALVSELARVTRRFGWKDTPDPTPAEAADLLREALAGSQFLLVVDNLGPDEDMSIVPVPGGACRTLVTSRSTTLHLDLENAVPLKLDLWTIEECLEFLGTQGLRRSHDTREDLRALAAFVGRLPLGVRLVAVMLNRRPGTSATDLLTELQLRPVAMLERYRGRYSGFIETFQATWDVLSDKGRNVLFTLAACANETRTSIVSAISRADETAVVLDDLVTRSLVQFSSLSETPWSLHDVVRMFIAEQSGFDGFTAAHLAWVEAHMVAHADPLAHVEFSIGVAEATRAFERLLANDALERAIVIFKNLRLHLLQVGRPALLSALARDVLHRCPDGTEIAAMCLNDLGICAQITGKMQQAVDFHERSLTIELALGRLEGQANASGNLGNYYWQLQEIPRAIECYEHALTVEKTLGRREGQSNALGNLGNCHRILGEVLRAINCHERALAIDEDLNRLEGQAVNLGNLGICYGVLGEIPRAISFLERSLEIDERLGRVLGQATQLFNLGRCYKELGDIAKARTFLCRALDHFRSMGLSDSHPSVSNILSALAQDAQ